ncbi:MAG: hypothetical protein F6J86_07210 [Symploca sp. SIO1B1]|nr:hypothetical protein [Symploca sp. SIO1B1]
MKTLFIGTALLIMKTSQLTRIDTLIITVGTRQVGWHCHDTVVRCLGADGDRGAPPHIDQLYQTELNIERGYHQENKPEYRWGVRDLAQRLYLYCQHLGDFSRVELLLDHKIIADCLTCGLKQIILWATNQPETVPWNFRRGDTLFSAQLMAGKIQQTFPELQGKVTVKSPVVGVKDSETIRRELETNILPAALPLPSQVAVDNQFVLAIENTGCAPDIANGLEICAAALVRQCQVLNIKPIEPKPLYQQRENDTRTAQTAQEYKFISVGDYFWPLERQRVISAWERGDFREAEIWLTSHQRQYERLLYQLASQLALSTNWEISSFLHDTEQGIETWLQSATLNNFAEAEQIEAWKQQVKTTQNSDFAQAWEAHFLIYLQLIRRNYTTAFMQFAQTLERLLSLHAQQDDWVTKGIAKTRSNEQIPSFYSLINAWCQVNQSGQDHQISEFLHGIRQQRNYIVYHAQPLTLEDIQRLWSNFSQDNQTDIMQLLSQTLKLVCHPDWKIPEKPLLRSLYDWGLHLLQSDAE